MEQGRLALRAITPVVHANLQGNISIALYVTQQKIEKAYLHWHLGFVIVKLVLLTLGFKSAKIYVEMELSKILLLPIVTIAIRMTTMDVQAVANGNSTFIALDHFTKSAFTMAAMALWLSKLLE